MLFSGVLVAKKLQPPDYLLAAPFCFIIRCFISDKMKPIVAEVWASMVAANLCKDVGVFDIIFLGDSQPVVNEINEGPQMQAGWLF